MILSLADDGCLQWVVELGAGNQVSYFLSLMISVKSELAASNPKLYVTNDGFLFHNISAFMQFEWSKASPMILAQRL
jgi:hypothetical protein